FNNLLECAIADLAFAVPRFVEVNDVDYSGETGVVLHDRANCGGKLFPECLRRSVLRPLELFAPADNRPARLRWQIETNQRMIGLQYLKRDLAIAELIGESPNFIVKDIR